jgi:hypothetical protein
VHTASDTERAIRLGVFGSRSTERVRLRASLHAVKIARSDLHPLNPAVLDSYANPAPNALAPLEGGRGEKIRD